MDHEELLRRYALADADLTPEQLAKRWDVRQYMQDKRERGEVLTSWSKDTTPIGLDDNMQPFPRSKNVEESAAHENDPDTPPYEQGHDASPHD